MFRAGQELTQLYTILSRTVDFVLYRVSVHGLCALTAYYPLLYILWCVLYTMYEDCPPLEHLFLDFSCCDGRTARLIEGNGAGVAAARGTTVSCAYRE